MCDNNKLEVNFSNKLKLHISIIKQQEAWEKAKIHSNGLARYNAYLNSICLYAFYDWLSDYLGEESLPTLKFFPNKDNLPSIWELVNGSAIQIGTQRLVVIPIETDIATISVPQEWVDIPNWAGDYYIVVQVDLEADTDVCGLSLCGFTTYRQLKNLADYNERDRTYILPAEQLTENMRVMQVILGLKMREEIAELPTLSNEEVNNLLKLLGDNSIYSPRLRTDIPFVKWAALISNNEWRQRLYLQRTSRIVDVNKIPNVNNLNQWIQNIFDNGWQSLSSILDSSSDLAFNFRHQELAVSSELSIAGIKLIDLGVALGNQALALLVGLTPETDEEVAIRVQLHPARGQIYLPENAKIALLSTTDTILQEFASRTQDNFIQLKRFTCQRGRTFKIRVIFEEFSVIETFTIEPLKNIA